MTETDDLEELREQKLAELRNRDDGTDPDGQGPGEPIHVDSGEHLQELTETYDTVLVDFYADWCGPCKMIAPVIEELATETPAAIAKVDVDAHQQLAAQFQVQGVPTLVLFDDGQAVEQLTGVQDKAALASLIQQHT